MNRAGRAWCRSHLAAGRAGRKGAGLGLLGAGAWCRSPGGWAWNRAGRTWRRSGQVAAWAAGAGPRGGAWRASHLLAPGAAGRGAGPDPRCAPGRGGVRGAEPREPGPPRLAPEVKHPGKFRFRLVGGLSWIDRPSSFWDLSRKTSCSARAAGVDEAGYSGRGVRGLSRGRLDAPHAPGRAPVSSAGPLPARGPAAALRRRRPAPGSPRTRTSPTHLPCRAEEGISAGPRPCPRGPGPRPPVCDFESLAPTTHKRSRPALLRDREPGIPTVTHELV